mgnify:CR=1 FL=1
MIEKYNLEYTNEIPDGHCLFRAFNRIEGGDIKKEPKNHNEIRNQIAKYLKDNILNNSQKESKDIRKQIIESIIHDGNYEIKDEHKIKSIYPERENNGKGGRKETGKTETVLEIDVDYIIKNKFDKEYIKRYIKEIESSKWGGNLEIAIWSKMENKCINVFQIRDNKLLLENKCNENIEDCINLFYHNGNHYGSLHPIKS